MRRIGVVTLVTAGVLTLLVGVLLAQGGGGGRRGYRQGGGAPEGDRLGAALIQAGLTDDERAAAEVAVRTKLEARRKLMASLEQLRATAEDAKASNDSLAKAIAAYQQEMARFRGLVQAQDKALIAKLSVRSQARCLAIGVLDNAVGMGGRPPRPSMGGPPPQ